MIFTFFIVKTVRFSFAKKVVGLSRRGSNKRKPSRKKIKAKFCEKNEQNAKKLRNFRDSIDLPFSFEALVLS